MVNVPIEIIQSVKIYLHELEKNKIHVERAVLFGSYSKGTQNEWSDIDIAISSPDFIGNRLLDRQRLVPINLKCDHRIEPMPFKSDDFNTNDLLVKEILETGIKIV